MTPQITPEHLVTVTQGASAVQIATLVLLGVISVSAIFLVVKWIIDLKLGEMPKQIREIQTTLAAMETRITKMESKLWDKDDLRYEIDSRVKQSLQNHIEHCPYNVRKN